MTAVFVGLPRSRLPSLGGQVAQNDNPSYICEESRYVGVSFVTPLAPLILRLLSGHALRGELSASFRKDEMKGLILNRNLVSEAI